MQNFNSETRSAIYLKHLGIATTVLIKHQDIEKLTERFEELPDEAWCNGLGKKHLHKILLRKLRAQDKYFDLHPNKVKPSNQKWQDFCDDCFILFCLDIVLNDSVVRLVHPEKYKIMIKGNAYDGTGGYLPDLVADIPTLQ